MTPADIVLAARRRYNAVNDNIWSEQELYDIIYAACCEIASDGLAIERTYSTPTVEGIQEYDFPSNAIAIKRATWNGRKLTRIDLIEDDVLTGMNQNTSDTGNPEFYFVWNKTISLRPVPASAQTLKLWTFNEPSTISTPNQEIEIPSEHHHRLINPVASAIAAKDQNTEMASYYLNLWERDKQRIIQSMRKMQRTDKFTTVKDEQMVVETRIGGS